MKTCLVLSVPGSGTNFTMQYLQQALGYTLVPWPQTVSADDGCYGMLHSTPPMQENVKKVTCVVPLRPPFKTLMTRTKHLRDEIWPLRANDMVKNWRCLIDYCKEIDVAFLPIETEDREYTLERVRAHLEAEIANRAYHDDVVRKWSKVNSREHRLSSHYERDIDEYPPLDFAEKWYQEIIRS